MICRTLGLIVIVALTILAVPLAAEAQQPAKMPRVGVLRVDSHAHQANGL